MRMQRHKGIDSHAHLFVAEHRSDRVLNLGKLISKASQHTRNVFSQRRPRTLCAFHEERKRAFRQLTRYESGIANTLGFSIWRNEFRVSRFQVLADPGFRDLRHYLSSLTP